MGILMNHFSTKKKFEIFGQTCSHVTYHKEVDNTRVNYLQNRDCIDIPSKKHVAFLLV